MKWLDRWLRSMMRRIDPLHRLRVECAYCQLCEFPMAGGDVLRIMARLGLCSQADADDAIAEAREKIIRDEGDDPWNTPPLVNDGVPFEEEEIPF
jgi:hypothetical protein